MWVAYCGRVAADKNRFKQMSLAQENFEGRLVSESSVEVEVKSAVTVWLQSSRMWCIKPKDDLKA